MGEPPFYREAAEAGIHLYIATADVLYAGRGWLGIHTITGRDGQINLPFSTRITNPLTGENVASSAQSFNAHLESGSTRLFRIEPAVKNNNCLFTGSDKLQLLYSFISNPADYPG